jgi:hypothetical protein
MVDLGQAVPDAMLRANPVEDADGVPVARSVGELDVSDRVRGRLWLVAIALGKSAHAVLRRSRIARRTAVCRAGAAAKNLAMAHLSSHGRQLYHHTAGSNSQVVPKRTCSLFTHIFNQSWYRSRRSFRLENVGSARLKNVGSAPPSRRLTMIFKL